VLDTHTLLHYQLPDSIKWTDVIEEAQVRLVIPLRVVEEIDAKKWGPSERLRGRSRSLLPRLEELVGLEGSAAPIRDGVTLEARIEPAPRLKPVDADEEILENCWELWRLSGQREGVTLVTGDTAMRFRAHAQGGIRPVALPKCYARDLD
jgi:predicted ribonuclease YlaK